MLPLQINKKKIENPTEKWAKHMNRQFPKKPPQMVAHKEKIFKVTSII